MAKKKPEPEGPDFPLQKDNYILLIIGFAIIMIGFLLMMGGKSDDPNVFNPEIFNLISLTPPNASSGEIVLTDTIRICIDNGSQVIGTSLLGGERRFDIGSLKSYDQTVSHYYTRIVPQSK